MHPILRTFLQGLPQLPRRRSVYSGSGVTQSAQRFGPAELVISRGLCRYSRFDFGRIPSDKRAAALHLRLTQWAPFARAGYAVGWSSDGMAMAWCWDAERLERDLRSAGLSERNFVILPESAILGAGDDGLRLLEMIEGYEAQQWLAGSLVVSRWWPARPTDRDWLAFLRDCNLKDGAPVVIPEAKQLPCGLRPFTPLRGPAQSAGFVTLPEQLVYAGLTLVLAVSAISLAVDQARLSHGLNALVAQASQQALASKEILDAREKAIEEAEQLKALHGLQRFPAPLVLMVGIARALPDGGGSYLRDWEMADGKLKILLATEKGELVGSDHVRALEQTGLFQEVKIVTQADPRQMAFILSLREQAALSTECAPERSECKQP